MTPTATPTPSQRTSQTVLGLALPFVFAGLAIVPFLLMRSSLPNPVATHFDLAGVPDGSMSIGGAFAFFGVLVIAGIALMVYASGQIGSLTSRGSAPTLAGLGAMLAGIGAAIASATAWTQRDLTSWTEARFSPIWMVWVLGLGVVAALVAARLAVKIWPAEESVTTSSTAAAPPTMELAANQRAVWASSAGLPWMLPLGFALIAVAALLALVGSGSAAVAVAVIGLATLAFSRLRVRADDTGLHINYGLFGFPRTHLPIDEIVQASATDVRPMEWGGWGYRGSLKVTKQAAVVVRAGAGLRLDLTGDRTFIVTIDDPETPAALLNALVKQMSRT